MGAPVIPPPSGFSIVSGVRRILLTVDIRTEDGERAVVFDYDEGSHPGTWPGGPFLRLYVTEPVRTSEELRRLMDLLATGKKLPNEVVRAQPGCGGAMEAIEVAGTPEQFAAVRAAMRHFYPEIRDPDIRAPMRSVYRQLGTLVPT